MKSSRHEIKAYKSCKDLQWHWVCLHTTAVVMVLQQLLVEGQETQASLLGKPHYHLCLPISIASLHAKLRRYLSQVCSSGNKLGSFLLLIAQDQEEHVGGKRQQSPPSLADGHSGMLRTMILAQKNPSEVSWFGHPEKPPLTRKRAKMSTANKYLCGSLQPEQVGDIWFRCTTGN